MSAYDQSKALLFTGGSVPVGGVSPGDLGAEVARANTAENGLSERINALSIGGAAGFAGPYPSISAGMAATASGDVFTVTQPDGMLVVSHDGAGHTVLTSLVSAEIANQPKSPPYTPFAARADVITTAIPAPVRKIAAVINNLSIAWGRDPAGALVSGDGSRWSPLGDAYPEHFGAVGDGVTDDTVACQAWVDFLRQNGRAGRMSGRTYAISHLEMMPQKAYSIAGDSFQNSEFLIVNTNRAAVGLNFGHVDGNTRVTLGVRLTDLRVRPAAGTKCCLVQFARNSDIQAARLKVSCFHGATGVRGYGFWNCDFSEVTVYGGGHNIPMKAVPQGAKFAIANNATTLTCNMDVFSADDVGRNITVIHPSEAGGQRHTISAFTDARTVTVSAVQTSMSHTASYGNFGGMRGSTTAGGNTLTLGAPLSSDDVGRVVYIVGGMDNPAATGGYIPLRARITAVAGAVATLDVTTPRTVAWAELVFDPAVDFGEPDPSQTNQKTNDATFRDLHIELHRGCGLVLYGAHMSLPRIKLHGLDITDTVGNNDQATNIQALIYSSSGYMYGHFHQTVSGNLGRIVMQDMMTFHIPHAETLGIHQLPMLHTIGRPAAPSYRNMVTVGTIQFYGNAAPQVFQGMIGDGWYEQYGVTCCASAPGLAKKHGNPTLITP